jgi:hypothetical protein
MQICCMCMRSASTGEAGEAAGMPFNYSCCFTVSNQPLPDQLLSSPRSLLWLVIAVLSA